jgi:hypothetical protein
MTNRNLTTVDGETDLKSTGRRLMAWRPRESALQESLVGKHFSLGNSVANIALMGKQLAGNIPAQRNCIGRVVIGKASQN